VGEADPERVDALVTEASEISARAAHYRRLATEQAETWSPSADTASDAEQAETWSPSADTAPDVEQAEAWSPPVDTAFDVETGSRGPGPTRLPPGAYPDAVVLDESSSAGESKDDPSP